MLITLLKKDSLNLIPLQNNFILSVPSFCLQKNLYLALALFLSFFSALANAEKNVTEKMASIIIDDLGNNLQYGQDIIKIPGAITIAVLPKTLYSERLAKLANKHNKEVMLHLPMQAITHHQLSPGTLDLHMTQDEFKKQLTINLNSIPFVRGINNHMGSLLTQHPGHMTWLMDTLSQRGDLYFVDSRTTDKTVAEKIAVEYNIPNLSRDFFLDSDDDEATLHKQFDRFINMVNKRGYALAIAHPYPRTIKFLRQNLKRLNQQGIRLVPASHLIESVNKKAALIKKSNVIKTAKYK